MSESAFPPRFFTRRPTAQRLAAATATGVASLVIASVLAATAVTPVNAGQWISGGTFDPRRGVAVNFRRFLASEGEGQMTVRCDEADGLWIDAGVTGNAEMPAGVEPNAEAEATFSFIRGDAHEEVSAIGNVLIRDDGAVVISISGENAIDLGPMLLLPSDRVDITVGDTTRSVPLADETDIFQSLAARCSAWP